MRSRLGLLLDLLHGSRSAALATHSVTLEGFPFVSRVAFVPDAHHHPVLLLSRLAEHTQNVLHDDRASLLLHDPADHADAARATLVGTLRPIDADPLLLKRYLRYHPAAAQFSQFGDFGLFRFEPRRARIIAGFAQAAWLEGDRIASAPALSLQEEAGWIERWQAGFADGNRLLGIDPFGVDLECNGIRERRPFDPGPVIGEAVNAALIRALSPTTRTPP